MLAFLAALVGVRPVLAVFFSAWTAVPAFRLFLGTPAALRVGLTLTIRAALQALAARVHDGDDNDDDDDASDGDDGKGGRRRSKDNNTPLSTVLAELFWRCAHSPAALWVLASQVVLAALLGEGVGPVLLAFQTLCVNAAPVILLVMGINFAVVSLSLGRIFVERFIHTVQGDYDDDDGSGSGHLPKAVLILVALAASAGAAWELWAAVSIEFLSSQMGAIVGFCAAFMLALLVLSIVSDGGLIIDAPVVSLFAAHALRRASEILAAVAAAAAEEEEGSAEGSGSNVDRVAGAVSAAGRTVGKYVARTSAVGIFTWLLPLPGPVRSAVNHVLNSATSANEGLLQAAVAVLREVVTLDDVIALALLAFVFLGGTFAADAKRRLGLSFAGDDDEDDEDDFEDLDMGDRVRRTILAVWRLVQPSTMPGVMMTLLYTHGVLVVFGDVPGIAPGWYILQAAACLVTCLIVCMREMYEERGEGHFHED